MRADLGLKVKTISEIGGIFQIWTNTETKSPPKQWKVMINIYVHFSIKQMPFMSFFFKFGFNLLVFNPNIVNFDKILDSCAEIL